MGKKNLLELMKDYSLVVECKANILDSITFLDTGNEQVQVEIKNTWPFILAPPNQIVINLTR